MCVIIRKVLSPFQVLFILSICILIGNTAALSLDSLHSSRSPEDDSFKTALDNIHYRRNMAEKRMQSLHYESRFSKKNSRKWRDQEEDEIDRKYYRPYVTGVYSPSFSRNVERFLSEIGDEDNKEVRKKNKESNKYGISHEEELKPDGTLVEESHKKKRPYGIDMDGPSRIFAHKSSPVTDSIQEHPESRPLGKDSEENAQDALMKIRKKGRSNRLNYSRGNEHYSRFWDPERRASNKFERNEMQDIRGREPSAFLLSKRRYSKRRSYKDEPLMKVHTNMKRSKDSKEQVMGELNEILKDEDEEKRDVKKRENDKEEKIEETKLDNSSDVKGNEALTDNKFDESLIKTENEGGDKFNEWLRDEYFKTMAMTMATMKKKRGTWAPIVSADEEGKVVPRKQLGVDEDLDEEKSQKFQAIEEKLEAIESAMLSDALQLIREGAEEREGSEAYGEQVLNKLYAANDVQKMREALDHLRRTLDNMSQYQDEDDDGNEEDDEDTSSWPNVSPIKREENLAQALGVMAPNQSKRQYPAPNGMEPYLPRVSMRSLPSFAPDDGNAGHLLSVYDSPPEDTEDVDVAEDRECPALDLLSSDCSVLGDIVPGDRLRRLVLEACNWHEVCYSCGGGFGLSADECDVGFVEQSRTICQDDIPCQTTARMMLLPLRQRRVFFKRSVPAICYQDPCVERFLQHG